MTQPERIISLSDDQGVLHEQVHLQESGKTVGYYQNDHTVTGYALTPGYKTYPGQGWYEVVIQTVREEG